MRIDHTASIVDLLAHRLRQLALSESGFVFDPLTGHTYSVNGSGLDILEGLKQELSPPDIAARLTELYELDVDDDPLRDVEEFVGELRKHSLIP